jgi:hypothetical protein
LLHPLTAAFGTNPTSRDVRYSSAYDAEADSPLISADFRNDPLPTIAKRAYCGALFGNSAVTIEN